MRGPFILSIFQTRKGRYKVYVTGHEDDHVMDWRGEAYVHVPVTGQPHLGFETFEEAEALMKAIERDPQREEHEFDIAGRKAGQWLPSSRLAHRCDDCGCVTFGDLPWCEACYHERLVRVRELSEESERRLRERTSGGSG